jgi:hypothetical protein
MDSFLRVGESAVRQTTEPVHVKVTDPRKLTPLEAFPKAKGHVLAEQTDSHLFPFEAEGSQNNV